MLKRFSLLLVIVFLLPLLSGCNGSMKATLDSQFTLAPGQSARIDSESMTIEFIGETADSRCPTGADCFWAGQVSCDIDITKYKTISRVTLSDSAGSGLSEGYTFQNYKITFSVSPYPEINKTIAKGDYRLTMTVSQLAY